MYKLYNYSLIIIFATAVVVFLLLFFISAPYGKFSAERLGPGCQGKMGMDDNGIPFPGSHGIFLFNSRKEKSSGDHFSDIMADPLYTQDIHISFYAVGQG